MVAGSIEREVVRIKIIIVRNTALRGTQFEGARDRRCGDGWARCM